MITEERLKGVILDQVNQLVEFDDPEKQLSTYNSQIHDVCTNIDTLSKEVLRAHPSLLKHNTFVF